MVKFSVSHGRPCCVLLIGLLTLAGSAASAPPPPAQVELGRHLFTRIWEPQLAGPESGDGLGPLFNGRSCAECHHQAGVGGGGGTSHNVQFVVPPVEAEPQAARISEFTRTEPPQFVAMLHRFGVRDEYADWRFNRLAETEYGDPFVSPYRRAPRTYGRSRPIRYIYDPRPAPPLSGRSTKPDVIQIRVEPFPAPVVDRYEMCSTNCGCYYVPRPPLDYWEVNTPPLFGLGLVEQITLADVQAIAAAQPVYIRGRPSLLPDGRLGRFGWKAQHASLRDFNDEACAVELGITTPTTRQAPSPKLHPTDDYETASPYWRSVRANPDITAPGVDALTAFVASLPVPRELLDRRRLVLAEPASTQNESHDDLSHSQQVDIRMGRNWFDQVGCATCHTADVGTVRGIYSDLLLHAVGTEEGDGYFRRQLRGLLPLAVNLAATGATAVQGANIAAESRARPGEFRTPPLWGVADSGPYLHDGRAATLEQAILAHRGQAASALGGYQGLITDNQRRQLLSFLQSLRAPLPY